MLNPQQVFSNNQPSDYILVQGNADLKDGWVFPRIWTTQKTKTAQAGNRYCGTLSPFCEKSFDNNPLLYNLMASTNFF